MTDIAPHANAAQDSVSMAEIDAENAVALPNKEVLSLLDINANVDLGLDLAAPVDLAAAANLNVAAPIEAAATANVLSPDAQAIGFADQQGIVHQDLSGTATATAPQHAAVDQSTTPSSGQASGTTPAGETSTAAGTSAAPDTATPTDASAVPTGTTDTATGDAAGTVGAAAGSVGSAVDGATGTTAGSTIGEVGSTAGSTVGDVGSAAGSALGDVGSTAGSTAGDISGGVSNLLNGGSLLDANVVVDANANLTAPIDGAVAANANIAAPVDAAVGANIGSPGATAEALAPQTLDIEQSLDNVAANATADQVANVSQH